MRLSLFRTEPYASAEPLYAAIVGEARQPHWYREAGVPDTLDGRFSVLTTLLALADLRLERGGGEARALGPRLAEAFIADMDAQMRQTGFGDPSLGKQVRMMVGSLAAKVDRWRGAVDSDEPWDEAVRASLHGEFAREQVQAAVAAAQGWWRRLLGTEDAAMLEGRIA